MATPGLIPSTVSCSCPRYTLDEGNLPMLKLLGVVVGIIAVLTFIVLAEAATRIAGAEQAAAPPGAVTRVVIDTVILVPNIALCGLLWRTGWSAWVHERLHGVVMRRLGVRPVYGSYLRARGIRGDYCMPARPHLFGRAAFAAITLAPLLVLFTLGVALSLVWPYSVLVSLALAWQVGSCSGDIWFTWHLCRAPRLALIEDLGNTIVIHRSEHVESAETECYRRPGLCV